MAQLHRKQQEGACFMDQDYQGEYFAAGIRKGPHMNKQEDRLAFKENHHLMGQDNSSFFAVFDGHGGYEAAEYCSKNLQRKMEESRNQEMNASITDMCKEMDNEFLNYAKHCSVNAGSTMLFSLL